MIDMVGANAMLANGGKRATPYAAIEIRNSAGEAIYTHAANGTPPVQVLPADKVAEMNNIMTHVLTEGTGRGRRSRASSSPAKPVRRMGRPTLGSTPSPAIWSAASGSATTTTPSMTGSMQGGALPAQTWREIMTYAHQGLETKPPFGVPPVSNAQIAAAPAAKSGAGIVEAPRQIGLSPKSAHIVLESATTHVRPRSTAVAPPSVTLPTPATISPWSAPARLRPKVALDFAWRAGDFRAAARSHRRRDGAGTPT